MLKALIKKQFLQTASFFFQGKNGKRRSIGAVVGLAALMVYGFGAAGAMFWLLSSALCGPLVGAGQGWIYFAFMGVMATALGIVGSVFATKSKLYEAKDNELLLSMPIPAWAVLLTRMLGLYLFTLLFEALVFVPAAINYFLVAGFSFPVLLCCILIQLVMPLGALAICCLLGFALAWLAARLPFKNLFTVLGFFVFMVGFSFVYSKVNEYLGYVVANGEAVGKVMQTWLYPFSQLGLAAEGNALSLLVFTLIFGGLFALVYVLISATYVRIATTKRGEYRAKYKEKTQRSVSPQVALLKREALHFIKSPAYLLNTSMGTMMMLIVGVMVLAYGDLFGISADVVAASPALTEAIGLLVAVITCFMASSNTIAACSVSLEGENIWLAQSLPVEEWSLLKAKLYLHCLMTAIPALLCGVAMGAVVELRWPYLLGVVLTAIVCPAFFAAMDLAINLKFPNLHWTNETAAVKQGMSMMFAMFGGWGAAALPIGGYFLFGKYLPAWSYLVLCLALFLAAAVLLSVWLKKRGTKIFKNLSA